MLNPFKWFSNKEIDEFSRGLAKELATRYTLEIASQGRDKKSEKKLGRALNFVYAQARDFGRSHRLGVYGTARLGNSFKWELKEMGYQSDFIEQATKGLILNVRGE